MKITIAGPGCHRCEKTEQNVIQACAELDLNAEIRHVYDVAQFAAMGVFMTPAVLVDGKIIMSGRVPSVSDLKALLPTLVPA